MTLEQQERYLEERLRLRKDRCRSLIDRCTLSCRRNDDDVVQSGWEAGTKNVPYAPLLTGAKILRFFAASTDLRLASTLRDLRFQEALADAVNVGGSIGWRTNHFVCPPGLAIVLSNVISLGIQESSALIIEKINKAPDLLRAAFVPWALVDDHVVKTMLNFVLPTARDKISSMNTPGGLFRLVCVSSSFTVRWVLDSGLCQDLLRITVDPQLRHLLGVTVPVGSVIQTFNTLFERLLTHTEIDLVDIARGSVSLPRLVIDTNLVVGVIRASCVDDDSDQDASDAIQFFVWILQLELEPFNPQSKFKIDRDGPTPIPPTEAFTNTKAILNQFDDAWFDCLLVRAQRSADGLQGALSTDSHKRLAQFKFLSTFARLFSTIANFTQWPEQHSNLHERCQTILLGWADFLVAVSINPYLPPLLNSSSCSALLLFFTATEASTAGWADDALTKIFKRLVSEYLKTLKDGDKNDEVPPILEGCRPPNRTNANSCLRELMHGIILSSTFVTIIISAIDPGDRPQIRQLISSTTTRINKLSAWAEHVRLMKAQSSSMAQHNVDLVELPLVQAPPSPALSLTPTAATTIIATAATDPAAAPEERSICTGSNIAAAMAATSTLTLADAAADADGCTPEHDNVPVDGSPASERPQGPLAYVLIPPVASEEDHSASAIQQQKAHDEQQTHFELLAQTTEMDVDVVAAGDANEQEAASANPDDQILMAHDAGLPSSPMEGIQEAEQP